MGRSHVIPDGAVPRNCSGTYWPHDSHMLTEYRVSAPYIDYWCTGSHDIPILEAGIADDIYTSCKCPNWLCEHTRSRTVDKLIPAIVDGDGDYVLIVSRSMLMQSIGEYVTMIETAETSDTCKCEWITHPDDTEVASGSCRICNEPKDADIHGPFDHEFKGKRVRRGETAMDCPVHTKEGFLLGFFDWMIKQQEKTNG